MKRTQQQMSHILFMKKKTKKKRKIKGKSKSNCKSRGVTTVKYMKRLRGKSKNFFIYFSVVMSSEVWYTFWCALVDRIDPKAHSVSLTFTTSMPSTHRAAGSKRFPFSLVLCCFHGCFSCQSFITQYSLICTSWCLFGLSHACHIYGEKSFGQSVWKTRRGTDRYQRRGLKFLCQSYFEDNEVWWWWAVKFWLPK